MHMRVSVCYFVQKAHTILFNCFSFAKDSLYIFKMFAHTILYAWASKLIPVFLLL